MSRLALALALATSLTSRLARAEDEPMYTCKAAPASMKISVEFQPETSLRDLAVWVMGFTCKNIVFSADVAKHATRVTIMAPLSMTPKQALQLFVDSVEATGLVVVQKPDTIIVKLGPNMPRSCPDPAPVASGGPISARDIPPPEPEPEITDAELDAAIQVTDATHRVIKSGMLDRILANPMALAKGGRIVPAMKDGKPLGFKLYAIRPGSVYARLGFSNGDTLQRVNGFELTTADKALEVYTKVREAKLLTIELDRRGTPVTLTFVIK
jgi:hypothetical protein